MPEKTKNLTVVKRDVNRNTSNQIISYGLPKSKEEQYGSVRLIAAATFYEKESYKKVMGVVSDELINNNGELEITEQKLNYIKYKASSAEATSEFIDEFSARYELPQTKLKYYQFAQSWESKDRAHGYTRLEFNKVAFGPPQTSPGRYIITKELIDSGNDLKFTYYVNAFNRRKTTTKYPLGTPTTIRVRLERIRQAAGKTYGNPGYAESIETTNRDFNIPLSGTYTLKNENMKEFDEWQVAGVAGTSINSYLGYLVDSSFWDIELISN